MTYELVKKKIVLGQNFSKESTQILLEGDIIVPDVKPDMSVMLQADSQVSIDKVEVLNDRVNYIGKLYIQVLYLARGSEKPVYSMSMVTDIDEFINVPGVTQDMWVDVSAAVQNVDYRMINDRKISYKAVTDILCKVDSKEEHEVVSEISDLPDNQQQKAILVVNKPVARQNDRFTIKDEVSIPHGKPNIREILQLNVEISNQDVKVSNGKVNIFGELLITTLYKGDSDESIIEFVEHEIPFNGNLDISGSTEDMFANVKLNLQDKYIQVRPDEDGEDRIIEIETAIGVSADISAAETIEILEDAYCINKELSILRNNIQYPKLISRNKNQSTVKEVVQIDNDCPDILQIFRVKGKVICDEVKLLNDKVVVEGVIDSDVLYIAESDDTPLYSHNAVIPFRQVIETKGSLPDMQVSMDAKIDHITFNMLSDREVEVRYMLSFGIGVTQSMEASMIADIEISDMDVEVLELMPSITVYVVEKGDSLWKIAKKYNTSIDEITFVNEIENPSKIYPGQKLLIIKRGVAE